MRPTPQQVWVEVATRLACRLAPAYGVGREGPDAGSSTPPCEFLLNSSKTSSLRGVGGWGRRRAGDPPPLRRSRTRSRSAADLTRGSHGTAPVSSTRVKGGMNVLLDEVGVGRDRGSRLFA